MTSHRLTLRQESSDNVRLVEQLDRVAGRIVEQNLLSTGTGDHIVSEAHARPAQPGDFGTDVIDSR